MNNMTRPNDTAREHRTADAGFGRSQREWARRALLFGSLLLLIAACTLLALSGSTPASAARTAQTPGNQSSPNPDDASLLETGRPAKPVIPPVPAELKLISFNIRWRGGEDLRKLIGMLRSDPVVGGASIIGLQEVDRNQMRTNNVNTARLMADELGMNYAWAAPPRAPDSKEEETGVAILSPYPLTDVVRLVLPHEGPNRRRRAGIGATVQLGTESVRFYSIHAETRLDSDLKIEQYRATLVDLQNYPQVTRAIVVGDFNTVKGKEKRNTRKLFTEAGFETPIPDDRSTFRRLLGLLKFKLDWFWLRGFTPIEGGVARHVEMSDHWPLWVRAKLK